MESRTNFKNIFLSKRKLLKTGEYIFIESICTVTVIEVNTYE